eukprot:CAMPEP_0177587138 /NCGR_PEP_ID=MMETSP0419_2-20121207/5468_1 /TAXON_ID=582737 /ORGANISM="Tetraselmis sp., Strain GSL018" /LENGTH=901 /DNA_ID=CAMNT_0019077121 /DNA_START=264 /DNA_END=2969 /DNA_ORIENTATION=+
MRDICVVLRARGGRNILLQTRGIAAVDAREAAKEIIASLARFSTPQGSAPLDGSGDHLSSFTLGHLTVNGGRHSAVYRLVNAVHVIGISGPGTAPFSLVGLVNAVTKLLVAVCRGPEVTLDKVAKRYAEVYVGVSSILDAGGADPAAASALSAGLLSIMFPDDKKEKKRRKQTDAAQHMNSSSFNAASGSHGRKTLTEGPKLGEAIVDAQAHKCGSVRARSHRSAAGSVSGSETQRSRLSPKSSITGSWAFEDRSEHQAAVSMRSGSRPSIPGDLDWATEHSSSALAGAAAPEVGDPFATAGGQAPSTISKAHYTDSSFDNSCSESVLTSASTPKKAYDRLDSGNGPFGASSGGISSNHSSRVAGVDKGGAGAGFDPFAADAGGMLLQGSAPSDPFAGKQGSGLSEEHGGAAGSPLGGALQEGPGSAGLGAFGGSGAGYWGNPLGHDASSAAEEASWGGGVAGGGAGFDAFGGDFAAGAGPQAAVPEAPLGNQGDADAGFGSAAWDAATGGFGLLGAEAGAGPDPKSSVGSLGVFSDHGRAGGAALEGLADAGGEGASPFQPSDWPGALHAGGGDLAAAPHGSPAPGAPAGGSALGFDAFGSAAEGTGSWGWGLEGHGADTGAAPPGSSFGAAGETPGASAWLDAAGPPDAGKLKLVEVWRAEFVGSSALLSTYSGEVQGGASCRGDFRLVSTLPKTSPVQPILETCVCAAEHNEAVCDGGPALGSFSPRGVASSWGNAQQALVRYRLPPAAAPPPVIVQVARAERQGSMLGDEVLICVEYHVSPMLGNHLRDFLVLLKVSDAKWKPKKATPRMDWCQSRMTAQWKLRDRVAPGSRGRFSVVLEALGDHEVNLGGGGGLKATAQMCFQLDGYTFSGVSCEHNGSMGEVEVTGFGLMTAQLP